MSAMPSSHGRITAMSSFAKPSAIGVNSPTAIRMEEDVMPGTIRLRPQSRPQKRKPRKPGRSV